MYLVEKLESDQMITFDHDESKFLYKAPRHEKGKA